MKKFKLNDCEKLSLAEAMNVSLNEVYIFDAQTFLFKYLSNGALKNLGYNIEEITQMHPWNIKPISKKEFLYKIQELSHSGNKKIIFETTHTRKDGSFYPTEVHLQPCMFGNQSSYIAVIMDITKQKALYEGMMLSSKLASLGEMAGGVAHEVNNPLAIIQGYMMKMRTLIDSKHPTHLDLLSVVQKTEKTVERIAKIILGMKKLSRDGSSDPFELISIQDIVSDSLSICSEKFKNSGVHLKIDLPKDDLYINCRKTELSQVLINLLSNAYDAVKNLDQPQVQITAKPENDFVKISVTDNGPGVEEEHREKILNPFYTTKKSGEGTGLGLSISKNFIKQHGGELFFDFNCKNTEVVIKLPQPKEISQKVS